MRPISHRERLLLAAAYLRLPTQRLRMLASSNDAVLERWADLERPRRIADARKFADETAEKLEIEGATLLAYSDPDYPAGLRELASPPPFLIVRGMLPLGGVAIVGSRTPTAEAKAFALVLARALREPVVAGLAIGIDEAAHRGAMDADVPTVAYVGHGIGKTYPPEHRQLEEEIIARGGAVASERLPGEDAVSWTLVQRDRLQAAHAGATVLVCSEIDGGAMHTMRFALELERPRFVVELQGRPEYGGNVQARRDGATPLPLDVTAAVRIIREALGVS